MMYKHRLVSQLYFTLTAHRWDTLAAHPEHFAALRAGVEAVAAPKRVLDVGTGAGGAAAIVAERFPEASVVGIDSSRRMIRLARRRYPRPNLEFRVARIENLPFADDSFDLVTLSNAAPELRELRRVLAPRGRALVASSFLEPPTSDEWRELWTNSRFSQEREESGDPGLWQIWRVGDG